MVRPNSMDVVAPTGGHLGCTVDYLFNFIGEIVFVNSHYALSSFVSSHHHRDMSPCSKSLSSPYPLPRSLLFPVAPDLEVPHSPFPGVLRVLPLRRQRRRNFFSRPPLTGQFDRECLCLLASCHSIPSAQLFSLIQIRGMTSFLFSFQPL